MKWYTWIAIFLTWTVGAPLAGALILRLIF